MSKLNQQLQLSDGRRLGYNEYGASDGAPLFYFHGSPSARIEFALYGDEDLLQSLNVRVIAVDRPGIGLSDFQPNWRYMDFPRDVAALADHMKIERFAILAYSGGGPYGAVCALTIPERLTRVGIVSGAAPFNQPGLADDINPPSRRFMDLSHEKPWLSRLSLWMMGVTCRLAPGKVIANALAALPEADREIMSRPEFQKGFLAIIQEALRQGTRGAQHDTRLMVSEWDFHPQDIQMPVLLWHGEADKNAPIAMGRYMAKAIPKSQARFLPDEGHLSLFKKKVEEIIRSLLD